MSATGDNLEDVYELSPMQEGMLFHTLQAAGDGVYVEQLLSTITGVLDSACFAQAWQYVADRHPVLRSAFFWEGLERPMQAVRQRVDVPIREQDWRARTPEEQAAATEALLEQDRGEDFALNRAPLMRVTTARLADDRTLCLWSHHHLLLDGWSVSIVLGELAAAYEALVHGRTPQMPQPRPYRDYIRWLRTRDESAAEAAWRREFAGVRAATPLPLVRPGASGAPRAQLTSERRLSEEETAAIDAFARQHGVTLNSLILGAWAMLLGASAGSEDVVCASSVSGRPPDLDGADRMVGLFINSLPVRVRLDPATPVASWLQEIQARQAGLREHDATPLVAIGRWLEVSAAALVESLVVVVNYPVDAALAPAEGALRLERARAFERTSVPLTVFAVPGRQLGLKLQSHGIYDAATLDSVIEQLHAVLLRLIADGSRPLGRVPLADGDSLGRLAALTSPSSRDVPSLPAHRLFEEQVERRPEATAVVLGDETLTYAALNARANQLARYLQRRGVGRECAVALTTDRTFDMTIGALAIMKAGGVYVPIDPGFPPDRITTMLAASGAPVVVTEERHLQSLPLTGQRVVCLDRERQNIAAEDEANLGLAIDPDALSYVVFTSGSTGTPKGAAISHRALVNLLIPMREQPGLQPDDRMIALATMSFDLAVLELMLPLSSGAAIVLADRVTAADGWRLQSLLLSGRVSVMQGTPSTWRLLLASGWAGDPRLKMLTGGEPLTSQVAAQLLDRGDSLWNLYGPTETTIYSTCVLVSRSEVRQPIEPLGKPLPNQPHYVLDRWLRRVPFGVTGEIYIGGPGVARGYAARPDLTAERFVPDPFSGTPGARLYRSGDLARYRPDGGLEFVGRGDFQVKIRGYRVELGEIEATIAGLPGVRECIVLTDMDDPDDVRLTAYLRRADGAEVDAAAIRAAIARRLPEYMTPAHFVVVDDYPRLPNGKPDRARLRAAHPDRAQLQTIGDAPKGALEETIAEVWRDVLTLDRVGADDNFFDVGGHSLLAVRVLGKLRERLGREISVVDLFAHPTVRSLAQHLGGEETREVETAEASMPAANASADVAIIGMAGRFPGAPTVEQFWRNLVDGVESIGRFTDEEVIAAGVDPSLVRDPHYVKAGGVLDGIELFDATFFGYGEREAEIMDPQQRLFLECAWEALEDAGHDASRDRRPVGVYAGMSMNTYMLSVLLYNPRAVEALGEAQAAIANLHDHLATRVSYKLDLRGPSFTVQTACSTSLVAVHLACRGLINGECDVALAGGVSVGVPQQAGYLYTDGGTHSPDGRCRAFDAAASGMVGGSGVGVIVLKRLADAMADGDRVLAVIKGTAINNDGASKVGYTAPSVEGQARVIASALGAGGVAADTIDYIEAHGTGTPIGDPIEVAALARVFPASEGRRIGLGSLKTNVGHLDAAAGVAGVIKTTLALFNRQLPASLHFERPNPRIDLAATPFWVVDRLQPWPETSSPRRAGVSSFGIGGTNAHVVLEEAPAVATAPQTTRPEIFVVSGRTQAACEAARDRLAAHLDAHPELSPGDVAWTLQTGRRAFDHRAAVVAGSCAEAAERLRAARPHAAPDAQATRHAGGYAFLFPGQGAQYPRMAQGLSERCPQFRHTLERCAAAMRPALDLDLLAVLDDGGPHAAARLQQTQYTQPALFAIEYALADLLIGLGVEPAALLGHSVGELVAACLAGVFTLEDACAIVARRGRLMAEAPAGAMLAVLLDESKAAAWLGDDVSLAAVNSPSSCVLTGTFAAIGRIEHRLEAEGIACTRLRTSHAFHSPLMAQAARQFTATVAEFPRAAPTRSFVSNVTGTWIDAADAVDPSYWGRQLRLPVRFADGLRTIASAAMPLIEVGPGAALSALARQTVPAAWCLTTLPKEDIHDAGAEVFLAALGRIWERGGQLEWTRLDEPQRRRRRVALPTYPFERKRYWVERAQREPASIRRGAGAPAPSSPTVPGVQLLQASWQRAPMRRSALSFAGAGEWLVLSAGDPLGHAIADRLARQGQRVVCAPDATLSEGSHPQVIVSLTSDFRTLVSIGRQIETGLAGMPVRLEIVTTNLHDVTGEEPLDPDAAMVIGPLRVIPQENANVRSRNIDVRRDANADVAVLAEAVVAELAADIGDQVVALRGSQRWIPRYVAASASEAPRLAADERPCIVFGGLGRIGLVAARALVEAGWSRIVLAGRHAQARPSQIADIEQLGARVLVVTADLEDVESVRAAWAEARRHFGPIGGVVHAAGPSGAAAVSPLSDMDERHVALQFGAKVRGLAALAQVVDEEAPSFVLLTSSLSSVLGGLGFAAYASANAFMDAFAAARSRSGPTRWVAVDWDGWRFDGATPDAIDAVRGRDAWATLLRHDFGPRVLAVAADLQPRLSAWINPGAAAAHASEAPWVPATDGLTPVVTELWQELLGGQEVGPDDNFFEQGGHSLLATQFVSRLRRRLKRDVPLRLVFECPTLRGLTAALEASAPTAASESPAIVARTKVDGGPLSSQQKRLWFLSRLDPTSPAYVIPGVVRAKGTLDVELLGRALDAVTRRHETLRTVFVEREGVPFQVVGSPATTGCRVEDVASEEQARRRAAEIVTTPFDLERGPLYRAAVLRIRPDDQLIVFAMHHIVSDGWSMTILVQELLHLYRELATGAPAPLPALTLQYADYAAWQEEWRHGPEAARQLEFWKRRLAGLPPLELPTDRPRGEVLTYSGDVVRRRLSESTANALRRFCAAAGVTPFMAFVGAFAAFLHRYTGQVDLAIGTPVAGRGRAELEPIVGLFINALVLRADLGGRPSFRAVADRIKQACLDAWAHQDLPFEEVVDAVQPQRAANQNPLFQVMFVLQNAPQAHLEMPGVAFEPLDLETGTAKFDLSVYLVEEGREWSIALEYNRDLFEPQTASRMLEHYCRVIAAAMESPDRPVAALPMLTGREYRQIAGWSRHRTAPQADTTIHELFSERAAQSPADVAVRAGGATLTYGELEARSTQLAHRLLQDGARQQVVALLVDRSPELIVALLGILKAGAAYLPIDPTHPRSRIAQLIEAAAARLVVASPPYLAAAVAGGLGAVGIDPSFGTIADEPVTPLPPHASPLDLAYVTFTSGSTGAPKGVAVPHRAVVRLVRGADFVTLTPREVVLQFAPLAFDASTFEIWGALLNGACLALAPPGPLSLAELGRVITSEGVTTAWLTAGLFHQMVDREADAIGGMRQLVAGGDVVSARHVRALLARAPHMRFVNGFGPTETTTFACCHPVTAPEQIDRGVPIGRPVGGRSVYVLDEALEPTPVGVPGELYIGGDGVARGYIGRADLTAERFVADPFAGDGSRMYRSGDRVRWQADGAIEFLGRRDFQLKIRGFRIEPGEIEAALLADPRVRDAVVVARAPADGERRLVAFVTTHAPGANLDPIRDALQTRLPDYLVPAAFVLLAEMPLTPNGKVDRAALPADRPDAGGEPAHPRTAEEAVVAQVWSEVLHVSAGPHDDFFALGGHSLLATQVIARLREVLGVEVPLRTLFTASTVEAFAAEIARAGATQAPAAPGIQSIPRSAARTRSDRGSPGAS